MSVSAWSTLIGRGMSRHGSHWSSVATPALLCHKESARCIQSALLLRELAKQFLGSNLDIEVDQSDLYRNTMLGVSTTALYKLCILTKVGVTWLEILVILMSSSVCPNIAKGRAWVSSWILSITVHISPNLPRCFSPMTTMDHLLWVCIPEVFRLNPSVLSIRVEHSHWSGALWTEIFSLCCYASSLMP